ncbi:MAG: hypothetical protein ACOCP8_04650 [archaeon]
MTKYKIIKKDNKKRFKKIYGPKKSNKIDKEYKKGKNISKLINYPLPLEKSEESITYEYLDIKESVREKISNRSLKTGEIKKIARIVSKLHENEIIHEDLCSKNVVETKDKDIYLIDASLEWKHPNTTVRKEFDLGKFIANLRWLRPLNKIPFFKIKKCDKQTKIFLKEYNEYTKKEINQKEIKKEELRVYENYYLNMKKSKKIKNKITAFYWMIFSKIIKKIEKNKKYI